MTGDGDKTWLAGVMEFLAGWTTAFCVWLAETVLTLGYPGIVFLMAVESSLVPFPSELVMPPAGYLIHQGGMSWLPVIASGVAGSLLGALCNYFLALKLGRPFFIRYGKYVFLKQEHLERAERFFAEHGAIATFVGRLIPVVRQLISLPAGLAGLWAAIRICCASICGTPRCGLWGWPPSSSTHISGCGGKEARPNRKRSRICC